MERRGSLFTYALFCIFYIFLVIVLFGFKYELSVGSIVVINAIGISIASAFSRQSTLKLVNIVTGVLLFITIIAGWLLYDLGIISAENISSKVNKMDFMYQIIVTLILILLSPFSEMFSKITTHNEFDTMKLIFTRTKLFLLGYFLFAIFFSQIYLTLDLNVCGSFNKPLSDDLNAFYFSIVTQTTLGFGEITPTSNLTKFLVSIHASIGVVALAIITGLTLSVGLKEKESS